MSVYWLLSEILFRTALALIGTADVNAMSRRQWPAWAVGLLAMLFLSLVLGGLGFIAWRIALLGL